jgi:hypothetical protein
MFLISQGAADLGQRLTLRQMDQVLPFIFEQTDPCTLREIGLPMVLSQQFDIGLMVDEWYLCCAMLTAPGEYIDTEKMGNSAKLK